MFRQFVQRRPVAAALFCAALQFLLTFVILMLGRTFTPDAMGDVKLVAFASTVVLPLLLTQALGLWGQVGLQLSKIRPHPVFLCGLAICLLFLVFGVHASQRGYAGEIVTQAFNAFGEELLFRGVIFAMLASLPRGRAILIGGLLFGAMHLMHGFMGAPWTTALWQACVTAMCGMMFGAVRSATGSLWLVVLLHMALNLAMLFSNIDTLAGPSVTFAVERLANVIELAIAAWVVFRSARAPRLATA